MSSSHSSSQPSQLLLSKNRKELLEKQRNAIVAFLGTLQTKHGSLDLALSTIKFCNSIVKMQKDKNAEDVIETFQALRDLTVQYRVCGLFLSLLLHTRVLSLIICLFISDFVVSNMILRTLHIIRGVFERTGLDTVVTRMSILS